MRIRFTRHRGDEVEGISLARFQVGRTYDVPTALATYLVTSGDAEAVVGETGHVVPVETRNTVRPSDSAAAADFPTRFAAIFRLHFIEPAPAS